MSDEGHYDHERTLRQLQRAKGRLQAFHILHEIEGEEEVLVRFRLCPDR